MAENQDIEQKIKLTYETNADSTAKEVDGLNNAMEGVNETQVKTETNTKKTAGALKELTPAASNAVSALQSMGKAMWALVANPLGAILAAIAVVIGVLFLAFKSFQPLVDKVEQAFAALGAVVNVIKNTFVALVTGTKSLGEAFSSLGGDMDDAAERTMKLVKAQQDLEDALKSQEVQTAKNRAEINKLNVELKNRTLSEEERLKIADKIVKLEQKDYLQRKKLVDAEVRQAREAIAIKAQFTAEEIKLLKETGDATKELAESRGGNYDEEYDRLNDARKKAIDLENDVTVATEKAYNRRDKLEDDLKEKNQKRLDDIAKAREKATEAEKKRLEQEESNRRKKAEDDKKAAEAFFKDAEEKTKAFNEKQTQLQKDQLQTLEDGLVGFRDFESEENQKAFEEKLKAAADDKLLAEQKAANNAQLVNQGEALIQNVKKLAGKNKAIQKAAIIAEGGISVGKAIANTSEAVTKDLAKGAPFSAPLVALDLAVGATSVASIVKGTNDALKAVGGGGTVQGGQLPTASGGTTASAQPQVDFQASSENQIATATTKAQQDLPPIKTYVVSKDMTDAQQIDKDKITSNSLGG